MNVERDQSKIFLYSDSKKQFLHFQENGEINYFPIDCGIAGEVFKSGEYQCVSNISNNEIFNGIIDINTNLPLMCFPISLINTKQILGIFEVPNPKATKNNNYRNKRNELGNADLEILEFFSNQLVQNISMLYEKDDSL